MPCALKSQALIRTRNRPMKPSSPPHLSIRFWLIVPIRICRMEFDLPVKSKVKKMQVPEWAETVENIPPKLSYRGNYVDYGLSTE